MSDPATVNRLIIPPQEAEKLVAQADRVYLRECPCRCQVQACAREKWEEAIDDVAQMDRF